MSNGIPKDWKPLRGKTYHVKEELKELGCRFDRDTNMWWAPPGVVDEAQEVIDAERSRDSFKDVKW